MSFWSSRLAAILLAMPMVAWAGGVEQLRLFLKETRSFRAEFAQSVQGKSGKTPQLSSGVVLISRPGKLRWEILKPYPQLMVGDGEKFWIYDPELRQVTVKKMGQALGSTPAALLSGSNDLEKNFTLRDGESGDGLTWVEAQPKSTEGGFEKLRFAFASNELRAMELHDNFGQTTHIRFSRVERNPALPTSSFRFVPPTGADVVGE